MALTLRDIFLHGSTFGLWPETVEQELRTFTKSHFKQRLPLTHTDLWLCHSLRRRVKSFTDCSTRDIHSRTIKMKSSIILFVFVGLVYCVADPNTKISSSTPSPGKIISIAFYDVPLYRVNRKKVNKKIGPRRPHRKATALVLNRA